jgi:hypothetical protein
MGEHVVETNGQTLVDCLRMIRIRTGMPVADWGGRRVYWTWVEEVDPCEDETSGDGFWCGSGVAG